MTLNSYKQGIHPNVIQILNKLPDNMHFHSLLLCDY